MYDREVRVVKVLVGRPEGKSYLEDIGVDGMIILRWIFKKWYGGMDWIYMAQISLRRSLLCCVTFIRNLRLVSSAILYLRDLVNAS